MTAQRPVDASGYLGHHPDPVRRPTANTGSGTGQFGECRVTVSRPDPLDGDIMRIDQADPRVRVAAELLHEINALTVQGEDRFASLKGDVLTLRGSNRTVVYRIDWDDYDFLRDTYGAEWPD